MWTNTHSSINDRLFNIKDLPTIPAIHSRILKIMEDINYSVDDVSKYIEKDQVLSSKVLKLINSPFYGLYSDVATIRRAVILLGSNLIRGIILSTSLFDVADKTLPGLWDHSYCCSTVAGFLAKRFNLITIEEIMTGALLHDIGKVLIKKQLPEESKEIEAAVKNSGITTLDAEKAIINITHDDAGLWLAETWNLPGIIKDIIAYHHKPGMCGGHARETAIVHLSDIIVKGIGVSCSGDHFVPMLDEAGWNILSLSESDLVDIIVEAIDIIQADKTFSRYIHDGKDGK
jgi:putative nucleotidyltransferase with HDIG domain